VGPVVAATVIGAVRDVARFGDQDLAAGSHPGTGSSVKPPRTRSHPTASANDPEPEEPTTPATETRAKPLTQRGFDMSPGSGDRKCHSLSGASHFGRSGVGSRGLGRCGLG
jgi:hypothetical protein